MISYFKLLCFLHRFKRLYLALRWAKRQSAELGIEACRKITSARSAWGPAKGAFSAYDKVQRGLIPGRVIFHGQESPAAPPQSLRQLCRMRQDQHQPWPFFWCRHHEAHLVGKTLLVEDNAKRICLEGAYGNHCLKWDPAYRRLWLPRPVRLSGNWASVLSQWSNGFYHWFMDALPRLAALPEFPPDTRVLVPAALQAYQRDTLRWLGLADRYRATSERHLLVENYYFASPVCHTGCYSPYSVAFLRRSFLDKADASYLSPRRFYVQRVGANRGLVNEEAVAEFFRERGWAVVDTAQLSMARQIQLFANAEAFCTVHGAAMTNLLWCRPGVRVLELCASTFLNGVYEGLAQILQANYQFMILSGDASWRGYVDLKRLEAHFESSLK